MNTEKTTEFVPVIFLPAKVDCERRADGVIALRSPEPLRNYLRRIGEHLECWAKERPDAVFLAQRDCAGWRKLTYAKAQTLVRAIATNLIGRNLSAERPVAILSENSIEVISKVEKIANLGKFHIPDPSFCQTARFIS